MTYATSDAAVATVDAGGVVTLLAPGMADITATVFGDSNNVNSNAVTFMVEAPTSFTFSEADLLYLLNLGPTANIDVTASSISLTDVPVEGYIGFSYSSSAPLAADIDFDSGLVTPLDPGSATITASLDIPGGSPFTETNAVIVEAPTSMTLTAPATSLFAGGAVGQTERFHQGVSP